MIAMVLALRLVFQVLAPPQEDFEQIRARLRDAMRAVFGCAAQIEMLWQELTAPVLVEATCEVTTLPQPPPSPTPDPATSGQNWGGP